MLGARSSPDELLLASRRLAPDLRRSELTVPTLHCGSCVSRVERLLAEMPGVARARANLSTRRVTVDWHGDAPPPLIAALGEAGFEAHAQDSTPAEADGTLKTLIRALAVAGFTSGNIMMLSVGVWSGADAESRNLLYWLSAAIALPAVAYSGRIFFGSAWQALRHRRTNMDVPVSIGVLLAVAMSLYETATHAEHAYFDAVTSLLFVLLAGRTLDHVMRERARTAVRNLARLGARGASVRDADGSVGYRPIGEIVPGMNILLAAGERVPVDARVASGTSDLDASLVTGESVPRAVEPGDGLQAGTLNLGRPIEIVATAAARDSFLAAMMRMMETAEAGRAGYRRIADRAAQLYAPVIHATALLAFVGWMVAAGDLHRALTIAIAVLIITCPCALGLAVPMVQVVAAQRLFRNGILVKDGGALERLAEIDHVVFDKTGTLTGAVPRLIDDDCAPSVLGIAAAMASRSHHPYAQAIAVAGRRRGLPPVAVARVSEQAGCGLEAEVAGRLYRLGRADWAANATGPGVVLAEQGRLIHAFRFEEALRPGVRETVAALQAEGLPVEILSGDGDAPVRRLASAFGIPGTAAASPAAKTARLAALAGDGRRVLMIGDGLNDAPSLMAAHVSMAPASAADIGRNAADIVLLRDNLWGVTHALDIARRAARLVRQNLLLATAYNLLAVPIAIAGEATPLVAAIAMSASSIVVVANALRLARGPAGVS